MDDCPITPGYTINIIRDKSKPAIILLNPPQNAGVGSLFSDKRTVLVKLPVTKSDHVPAEDSSWKASLSNYKPKVPETSHNYSLSNKGTYKESIINSQCDNLKPLVSQETGEVTENNSRNFVFLDDVAHEEIVIENVFSDADIEQNLKKKSRLLEDPASVYCDLCQNKFNSRSEARAHMKKIHEITFEGPFFKCEFCSFHVSDRVSHMKTAHYSPLSGAFTRNGNLYNCRQCSYVSDQLTNIRNHVDAKHNSVENKYACEECNTEYKTLNSMRAHRSRVHMKKKRLLEESDKARNTSFSPFVKLTKREHVQGNIQREILDLELKTKPNIIKSSGNKSLLK